MAVLAFDDVAQIVMEVVESVVLIIDLVDDRFASFFDSGNLFTEFFNPVPRILNMLIRIVGIAVISPEEMRGAHAVEFLERLTDLLEQFVLMISLREAIELIIDRSQVSLEFVEHTLRLLGLLPKRLLFYRMF